MTWKLHSVIEVSGDPKGQPRHRSASFDGKARAYPAGSAEGWKIMVVIAARGHLPFAPLEGPIRIDAEFYFRRPQRLRKKSSPAGFIPHTAKPDRDNLDKAVLDCLKQIGFIRDDCFVSDGKITKRYTRIDSSPGALIEIYTPEET